MKRLLLCLLLLCHCSWVNATTIDGSTLTNLSVISSSGLGTTLLSAAEVSATALSGGLAAGVILAAGVAYYQHTGQDPVYAAASSIASGADALFIPAYQAFKANFVSPESFPASAAQYVGKEGSVGATIGDLINFVGNSASGLYPNLKSLFSASSNYLYEVPVAGEVVPSNSFSGMSRILSSNWAKWADHPGPTAEQGYYPISNFKDSAGRQYFSSNDGWRIFRWPGAKNDSLSAMYGEPWYAIEYVDAQPAYGTGVVPVSPTETIDYDKLKKACPGADSSTKADMVNAVKDMPASQKITSANAAPTSIPATAASPITNKDITNFFTANTTNVYNEYLNTVNNGGDVNAAKAAAETAAAQAAEAQKDTEDSYNPISSNAFTTAYNPGEFDIPARFTSFLQNVKSSGLFSFSTAFFNSLPGGGSPLLTIEGGQTFGTHTFDFSQSLGGGLAILKSVLLALFGFLSVRAVIMKR